MIKLEQISKDLFNKIRGKFPEITIGDQDGSVTNIPEQARFFEFEFSKKNVDYGKVTAALTKQNEDRHALVIIYNKDLVTEADEISKNDWFNFLKEMRKFAKKRLMNFEVRDINKANLKKSDYLFLAKNNGESPMQESKMYGTSKISYQNVGEARLMVRHSQPVGQDAGSNRSRYIESIYIESAEGERFKYPYRHLSGARAMARHVAEGGKPYDDFGSHITGLSEEMSKLRKFKTYMGRSAVMAESLAEYMDIVKERISTVKKTIENLQKPKFYQEAVNGFEKPMFEEVPEDVAENWIDELTIRQFNEELKDVFPYIYNLVKEGTKAKVLSPDDLVDEDDDPCWKGYRQLGMKKKNGKEVPNCVPKEEIELEQSFEEMMGQYGDTHRSNEINDFAEDQAEDKPSAPLSEFILSYFDYTTGQFPKGETAVLTMVEKDYGEEFIEPAKAFIDRINERVAEVMGFRQEPEIQELDDISRLAGL